MLKDHLVDEQCRSHQLGLSSSVGTVWTFHLKFVGVGEKFGAETKPNLTDLIQSNISTQSRISTQSSIITSRITKAFLAHGHLSVGWAVDSFGLCARCRPQLLATSQFK